MQRGGMFMLVIIFYYEILKIMFGRIHFKTLNVDAEWWHVYACFFFGAMYHLHSVACRLFPPTFSNIKYK